MNFVFFGEVVMFVFIKMFLGHSIAESEFIKVTICTVSVDRTKQTKRCLLPGWAFIPRRIEIHCAVTALNVVAMLYCFYVAPLRRVRAPWLRPRSNLSVSKLKLVTKLKPYKNLNFLQKLFVFRKAVFLGIDSFFVGMSCLSSKRF